MGAYLSSPKTNKESCDGGNLEVDPSRFGLSCMQGWRKNMEDSHICYNNLKLKEIEEDISIYGVFDGHGGPNVSKWISYNFRRIFLKCIKEANEELIKQNLDKSINFKLKLIKLTLEKTFLKLDEEMLLTENQEKLKKYSVPTQENEEESDTRENYIYSILNDIMSKNISIKAIERDGKRCLQVVYNKDGNPVGEEGSADPSSLSISEENCVSEDNNKSSPLFDSVDQELTDEKYDSVVNKEDEEENKSNENNDMIKKDDVNSDSINTNDNNGRVKEEKEEKKINIDIEENKDSKKENKNLEENNDYVENNKINGESTDKEIKLSNNVKVEESMDNNKGMSNLNEEQNVMLPTIINEENKIKTIDDNKENSDCMDNEETNAINTKRLKKDITNCLNNEKDIKEEEKLKNKENDKVELGKSELTYDNLKCMEESSEGKSYLNESNNNNDTHGNINYEENSTRLYERSSSSSEEGIYDEAVTNVIDNNISSSSENNNEGEDCNGIYSSEELRLFENYYSNDYEDNIAYSCGSTALVAVILKGYLIVANAGDSRAIVCFNGNSLGMSTDHKPHLQSEEARIKKAGGYIANGRVDGNLNLTRAIGDLHYKRDPFLPQKDQKISAFPEITCVTLTPEDEFLFLACDGIWDCKEGHDIVGFVKTRLEKFEEITDDNTVCNGVNNENNNNSCNENENVKDIENKLNKDENSNSQESEQNDEIHIKNIDNNVTYKDDNNDTLYQDENKINTSQEENKDENEVKENNEDKHNSPQVIERKKFEKFNKLSQICEELCDECLSNNYKENDGIGCDNMTCLLVQYNPLYKMQTEKKFLNIDEID
ncbi:protein phosphatase PPM2, putative [Plasmodium gallinaceum]|uniref:protein-serine/threonine phosphatase n=1 Tax=Plasmodium gallinaceum TaxID=5849 RepID=A0A1J1GVB4_PLAGA|nr:protein phosphatase PPM2, putative [Plasmodium gallinaceum]CRG96437.1 protein phosphatase PPM2, putative [Plasmodium gallinaceum]